MRAAHLGPQRRRPLVLDAALEVLLRQGYANTTMSTIAAAAGVTKPVVYECFATKDDLLKSLFRREEARLLEAVEAALPTTLDFTDLRLLLTDSYAAFFTAVVGSPDSWRLVVTSDQGLTAVTRHLERARGSFVSQIQQMVLAYLTSRDSSGPAREALVIAETLVSVAESGARILLAPGSDWSPDELANFLTKNLLNAWP